MKCCAPTGEREDGREARGLGLRLEWATLGWNVIEAVVAVWAGVAAASIALVGFGLDSVIECLSGAALIWRLSGHAADERRERVALRMVGWSFLILAAYVAFDAVGALIRHEEPDAGLPGIVIASLSLVVMPLLARAKRGVARRMASAAMTADARQTDICAYLSAILLVGLALNATLGWRWGDPVAALLMTPIIAREGVMALRGKTCSC